MTEVDVSAARALCDAATPGPWEIFRYRHGGGRIHVSGDDGRKRGLIADMDGEPDSVATVYNEGDREFLFAARSGWPAALDEIERLRARIEWLDRGRDRHNAEMDAVASELADTRREASEAREALQAAERKIRAAELLHVWTNEDGRRFVFVDDLGSALEIPGYDSPAAALGGSSDQGETLDE